MAVHRDHRDRGGLSLGWGGIGVSGMAGASCPGRGAGVEGSQVQQVWNMGGGQRLREL